ncbi:hypothetical protein MTO96_015851 [Rhipicephalus appendiculatus]
MLGVIALATLLLQYCAVESASPPARKASVKGTTGPLRGLEGTTQYPPKLGGTTPNTAALGGTTGKLPGLQGETKYPPGLQGETKYPPGSKGTAPSPQKPKPKYLCGNATSCNFGSKRSCLLTDGIKSPVMCVNPPETCEVVGKTMESSDG